MTRLVAAMFAANLLQMPASAQPQALTPPPTGTLVVMTGVAEIELPNNEAVADLYFEAQDADLTRAQAQVSKRINDGTAALKRADPKAVLESSGYSSYPVYADNNSTKAIIGWRVRQGVTLRTENLDTLPKTIAAAQPSLALGRIDFRLSKAAREKVESQLIQQAMMNLNSRFAAAAQSMKVAHNRIRVEEVDFDRQQGQPRPMVMRSMAAAEQTTPTAFEAGRSIERLVVSGKARLLP